MAYCIGLDACRFLKSGILFHVRVTHEDVYRQMLKNETNFLKMSDIVLDKDSLYISNNNTSFYSNDVSLNGIDYYQVSIF